MLEPPLSYGGAVQSRDISGIARVSYVAHLHLSRRVRRQSYVWLGLALVIPAVVLMLLTCIRACSEV